MIISHKYKFIFLKTNKTAGTSIEIALSGACGDDDIISPIAPVDERIREKLGYRGPQNHLSTVRDFDIADWLKFLVTGRRKSRYYGHMPAGKIKALIGEDIWNEYYKFCFERNPWDRVISLYYWRWRSEPRPTISQFIATGEVERLKQKGHDLYFINGKIAVDKVYLFEDIAAELDSVRAKLGITEKLELPNAKSNFRKDKRSYRDILNADQQAKIAELFSDEINLMDYEF